MKFEFSRQIFEKVSNIKFYQNPSSGNRVVPDGETDMKLIVAFRNYAKARKNVIHKAQIIVEEMKYGSLVVPFRVTATDSKLVAKLNAV
jgi:hypothetical protein